MGKGRENVVLFPFMAQGHILPFLVLAQQMERKGYAVTFVNTPLNIKKLRESLPPATVAAIRLVGIPFNSSDYGLPPDSEDTDSLPYSLSLRLLEASIFLKLPFKNLLADLIQEQGGERPVCVISDLFFGWAADVAHAFGIFHAIFSITGGFGMACYCSMWLNLPHKNTDSHEFQLPDFPEAGTFHITQLTPAVLVAGEEDQFTDFQRRNIHTWSDSDALLFNTVEELDKTGLMYFRRKLGVPVWGIGPLLLPVDNGRAMLSPEQCIEWLDKKEPKSVIYICFGSQNTISASQMMNLAKALDASGRSFIWVVRPPLGFDINAEFVAEQWLPEGFLQRIQDEERGLIVCKWAPQPLRVEFSAGISQKWGSNDQLADGSRAILQCKVVGGGCRSLRGGGQGTNFEVRQEDIMEKIELVVGENEKGREIRRKSQEMKEMLGDAVRDEENYRGSSVKAMQEFFVAALTKKEHRQLGQHDQGLISKGTGN
ncbi:UNVERIFIED_CONTAM: UDP-glycosyltransferase 92A1 [Sesamum angustifolium]|uniref:UDP-glycosyltransferase 92A1 n=1 Tax=Sesamum angustifolium TaxID=2727405 RepID=A0AAW2QTW9_9LAMI